MNKLGTHRRLGPNVKRLMIERASQLAVPPGAGFAAAIRTLISPGVLQQNFRNALHWVDGVIAEVKAAPDNSLTTDEEIAGHLLKLIAQRKQEQFPTLYRKT